MQGPWHHNLHRWATGDTLHGAIRHLCETGRWSIRGGGGLWAQALNKHCTASNRLETWNRTKACCVFPPINEGYVTESTYVVRCLTSTGNGQRIQSCCVMAHIKQGNATQTTQVAHCIPSIVEMWCSNNCLFTFEIKLGWFSQIVTAMPQIKWETVTENCYMQCFLTTMDMQLKLHGQNARHLCPSTEVMHQKPVKLWLPPTN